VYSKLEEELKRLTVIKNALSNLAVQSDDDKRSELVNLRRRLAEQMAVVSKAAETDPKLLGDALLAFEFRSKFSAMRSAIASHQANWPAVKIDHADPRFRQSAASAVRADKEFADWLNSKFNR
jgi:hypothetical protein